jgi:rRNA maturation endonuclease Nob1
VRPNDIPAPDPVSPTRHLEERRAAIYENLRDLQFEYRVGKLSDTDYQQTKLALQKELAAVIGEIQQVVSAMGTAAASAKPVAASATVMAASGAIRTPAKGAFVCPHCGADFPVALKFCGECGKEMQ